MNKHWLRIAKTLPLNGHARSECCGSDKSAIISHSSKGYRVHCFRCGFTEMHKREYGCTLNELKMLQKIKEFKETATLPSDTTFKYEDFSTEAIIWLLRAGVTSIKKYGIGYSKSIDRVMLPVYNVWGREGGKPTGYQARSIHGKPRYISSGDCGCHVVSNRDKFSTVCLVEDWLSSVRVGDFVRTIALLGTSLTDKAIRNIIDCKAERIFIWLDSDQAGQTAAQKIVGRLKALELGACHIVLHSSVDPKLLSNKEIKQILNA